MTAKLRLGLVIDPEFALLEKSVCALTPPLVRGLCKQFATRIIYDQSSYDRLCTEVDFLVSMEPRWAAPVLRWARAGRLRRSLPRCPCYVMMSDPQIEQWREGWFVEQGLDFILALYDAPFRRHFTRVRREQLVHFPWCVPDAWIGREAIAYRGQPDLAIFGASSGDVYTLRNWCRTQPGVRSFANSGVENKVLGDVEFFRWLEGFDAVIAAGSEDPRLMLTTPKYFETAAAGSLLFAMRTDDLATLGFADGESCLVFTQATFAEVSRRYLAEPASPRWLALRDAGRELVRARHSLSRRLGDLAAHVSTWSGR